MLQWIILLLVATSSAMIAQQVRVNVGAEKDTISCLDAPGYYLNIYNSSTDTVYVKADETMLPLSYYDDEWVKRYQSMTTFGSWDSPYYVRRIVPGDTAVIAYIDITVGEPNIYYSPWYYLREGRYSVVLSLECKYSESTVLLADTTSVYVRAPNENEIEMAKAMNGVAPCERGHHDAAFRSLAASYDKYQCLLNRTYETVVYLLAESGTKDSEMLFMKEVWKYYKNKSPVWRRVIKGRIRNRKVTYAEYEVEVD